MYVNTNLTWSNNQRSDFSLSVRTPWLRNVTQKGTESRYIMCIVLRVSSDKWTSFWIINVKSSLSSGVLSWFVHCRSNVLTQVAQSDPNSTQETPRVYPAQQNRKPRQHPSTHEALRPPKAQLAQRGAQDTPTATAPSAHPATCPNAHTNTTRPHTNQRQPKTLENTHKRTHDAEGRNNIRLDPDNGTAKPRRGRPSRTRRHPASHAHDYTNSIKVHLRSDHNRHRSVPSTSRRDTRKTPTDSTAVGAHNRPSHPATQLPLPHTHQTHRYLMRTQRRATETSP